MSFATYPNFLKAISVLEEQGFWTETTPRNSKSGWFKLPIDVDFEQRISRLRLIMYVNVCKLYLKYLGSKSKTAYLRGPHSPRPRTSLTPVQCTCTYLFKCDA